jgi:sphingomyelin phosphodiesterase 2
MAMFRRLGILLLACAGLGLAAGCGLLRFGVGGDYAQSSLLRGPLPLWSAARTVRVVTFNIKDMYWLSEHRGPRMTALGALLAAAEPDVVCLQEAFVGGDVATIAEALAAVGVAHVVDFPAGVVGSGLCVLSRFPVAERYFLKFARNGAMLDTRGGDWWAGKGVALARLQVAPGEFLDVYNTHMICGLGPDELNWHRRAQVRECASFVVGAVPENVPALLLGDFNCWVGSAEFEYLAGALHWQPLWSRGLDHVCGHSHGGRYQFTPMAKQVLEGQAVVDPTTGRSVELSDHQGLLVDVHITAQ